MKHRERKGGLGCGVVIDEGAAPLPPRDDAFGLHDIERFAHRSDADAELLRKLPLVRKGRPRLPVTDDYPLHQRVTHLQIERPYLEAGLQVCHAMSLELETTSPSRRIAGW